MSHLILIEDWNQLQSLSDQGIGWLRGGEYGQYDLIGYVTMAKGNYVSITLEDKDGTELTVAIQFNYASHHVNALVGSEQYFRTQGGEIFWEWLPNLI
tara:strand:+ start:4681 stop:4974 length:294 start_codon:yes stop_codon:yes gene_type:complete